VVWAAAAQRDGATADDLNSIAVTLVYVLCWQVATVPTAQQQTEGQKLQKLLLLVPALLLHWVGNTPALTEEQVLQCAINAVLCSQQCIQTWLKLDNTAYTQVVKHGMGGLQERCEIHTLVAPEPWLQPYFPAVWLKQVLPDIQKLLAVLLPYCWQQQATGTASQSPGASSTATDMLRHGGVGQLFGSVRGSSLTGGSRTVEASVVLPKVPGRVVVVQCQILQLAVGNTYTGHSLGASEFADQERLRTGVEAGSACDSRSSTSRLHQLTQPLAEFRSLTARTLASLEGFIRASAQQLAAGSMLNTRKIRREYLPNLLDLK